MTYPTTLSLSGSKHSQHSRNHFIPNFEVRSVVLMAALALGAINAAHAQTSTPSPASPNSPPSQMGASAGGVPSNKASSKDMDAAFDRADANHDGQLDRKEAEKLPAVAQRFDQLDTNQDKFISREEFSKLSGS